MANRCLLALTLMILSGLAPVHADTGAKWWADDVEQALVKSGKNRPELEKALAESPKDERAGMSFLIANMPDGDLKSLKSGFLLTNNELAYKARKEMPWGKEIPEEIFLNDVLPYANVDETREPWRKEFFDLCVPMVKGCKTPTEATQKLNSELFKILKLRYSTQRKAPNQSPKESISQGMASCTGLSIVLVDACRAIGVPARVVGTPLWANKRGNHTWVEVWDKDWHFTGACEADPSGLDRGWFVGDAGQAKKDSFEHSIYAASFRKTKIHFPMVWAMSSKDVPAENVTDRYARKAPAKPTTSRVDVKVTNTDKKRIAVKITVTEKGNPKAETVAVSKDEMADTNDFAGFDLPPEREIVIVVPGMTKTIKTPPAGQRVLVEFPPASK